MATLEDALRRRESTLLAEMCDFISVQKGLMEPDSDRYLEATKLTVRYDELAELRGAT